MRSVLCFSHSRNFGKKISLNKIPQGLCISVTSVLCNFLLQKSFFPVAIKKQDWVNFKGT